MKDAKTIPQILWLPLKPLFPLLRTLVVRAGLVTPPTMGRHRFPLGFLRHGFSTHEFRILMRERGFFHQPMAFTDPGQVASLRRLDPSNHLFQYHVRLYKDGEVRGHYEKTPEDCPLDHLREIGFTDRRDKFRELLSGLIDETKVIELSNLEMQGHTEAPLYYTAHPEAAGDGGQ